MEPPPTTPQRTSRRTPVKKAQVEWDGGFAAMDLTKDDRVVLGYGSHINFLGKNDDSVVQGWRARSKRNEKETFSPRKLQLYDKSAKTLLLSPARKNTVHVFDTERGVPLAELEVKNTESSITMPVDTMAPSAKFAQLQSSSVVEEVALSGNMVFELRHDLRAPGEELIVMQKAEIPGKKGVHFTAVATTGDGHVVAGTNTGEIKLFARPENGAWTRAKTSLNQLAAPVTAVDVSYDGEWVLWTTEEFLALMNVRFVDPKTGASTLGFEKSIPTESRPSCLLLRVPESDRRQYDMGAIRFTPARFDSGPSMTAAAGGRGVVTEDHVVASTGPFVVSWNLRQLKLDYHRAKDRDTLDSTVPPRIIKQDQLVLENLFEYNDSDVLVSATADQLSRLALAK